VPWWKGTVRFEDEFTADACSNLVEAQGGCVWNGGDAGKMVFKGETSMSNCGSSVSHIFVVFCVQDMDGRRPRPNREQDKVKVKVEVCVGRID